MTFSVAVEGAVAKTQTYKVTFQVQSLSDENEGKTNNGPSVDKFVFLCQELFGGFFYA